MSYFIKGDQTPNVYEMGNGAILSVGSEATLADLWYAGHGRSVIPDGFGKKITVNGVPVREVAQRHIDDLT